jgi:hypothetical protein
MDRIEGKKFHHRDTEITEEKTSGKDLLNLSELCASVVKFGFAGLNS